MYFLNSYTSTVSITGTVFKVTPKSYGNEIIIGDCCVGDDKISFKIQINSDKENIIPGDIIKVNGTVNTFEEARNEGNFDKKRYYESIGISYKCTPKEISVIRKNQNPFNEFAINLRENIRKSFDEVSDETDAGIYASIVLGDKSTLDEDVKDMYTRNGIAHILAISGLHISIIGMMLYRILKKMGFDNLISTCISISAIIFYGAITGNGISTMRAIVMLSMSIIAVLLGRTYDILSAMCIAVIMLVMENPLVIENSGFQLSFAAILGIGIISPAFANVFKTKSGVVKSLMFSVSISIATLPVTLLIYYEVPVFAVFINLIIIPLMPLVMISALMSGVAGIEFKGIALFLSGGAHYCLELYNNICEFVEALPFNKIVTGKPEMWRVVLYVIVIGIFVACSYKKTFKKYAAFLVIVGLTVILTRSEAEFQVKMIDVGQGDSILITTENNKSMLFDCGSSDIKNVAKYRVEPMLKSIAIEKLDYVYLSHSDVDHVNGIIEMINNKNIEIGNIILPNIKDVDSEDNFKEIIGLAKDNSINISYMSAGKILNVDNVNIECIHPSANYGYTSSNEYSAVYILDYKEFSMIMTGDADSVSEKSMVSSGKLRDIDVLKTGHHGSKNSSSDIFLTKIKPEIALISCGINNRYGHPSKEAIERITNINAKIYITAECGEITVKPFVNNIEIKTFR